MLPLFDYMQKKVRLPFKWMSCLCGLGLLVASSLPATAQSEQLVTSQASVPLPTKLSNPREPQVVAGQVQLISKMLSRPYAPENLPMGQIDDVVLDFETGHAVFVVTRITAEDESEELGYLFLPIGLSDPQQHLAADRTPRRKLPNRFTRKMASNVYLALNRDIYWLEFCEQLTQQRRAAFNESDFELQTFSHVKNRSVTDIAGDSIGKIVDFAIDPQSGRIVYCVLESSLTESPEKEWRAVPLGAFVKEPILYRWKIEMEAGLIRQFETIDPLQPPPTAGRGWEQFIAVNYGRDGLQPHGKLREAPETEISPGPADAAAMR